MKYHFSFSGLKEVEFDGARSSLWNALDLAATWEARPSNKFRQDFAWGYFAAERAGKLEDLGVNGMSVDEAVDFLADNFDMEITDAPAPLAKSGE